MSFIIRPYRPSGTTIVDSKLLDEIHKKRGYSRFYWGKFYHIGYHYIILPDGTLQSGRPERCQTAHARSYNSLIGICLVGEFDKSTNPTGANGPAEPTKEQMDALVELVRSLKQRHHIPRSSVFPHSSLDPGTECPGREFPFDQFRARLERGPLETTVALIRAAIA